MAVANTGPPPRLPEDFLCSLIYVTILFPSPLWQLVLLQSAETLKAFVPSFPPPEVRLVRKSKGVQTLLLHSLSLAVTLYEPTFTGASPTLTRPHFFPPSTLLPPHQVGLWILLRGNLPPNHPSFASPSSLPPGEALHQVTCTIVQAVWFDTA